MDFVTIGAAIMFFFRRNIICRVAAEELIVIFIGQCSSITQSGNFAIVHQFIHLNENIHKVANTKFEFEQSETEYAV